MSTVSNYMASLSPLECIDRALGEYYAAQNIGDYFDEHGRGRFLEFFEVNDFDESDIDDELGDDMENCQVYRYVLLVQRCAHQLFSDSC